MDLYWRRRTILRGCRAKVAWHPWLVSWAWHVAEPGVVVEHHPGREVLMRGVGGGSVLLQPGLLLLLLTTVPHLGVLNHDKK